MEHDEPKPAEAKDYYTTTQRWWSENNDQAVNGVPSSSATKHDGEEFYDLKEILTPQVPREGDKVVLNDLLHLQVLDDDEDDNVVGEKRCYSGQAAASPSEIEEIFEEDGEISKTENRESTAKEEDDIYVAVGKDDVDVVKWALDHVVSASSRVFFIHVSAPITLIPTPVGNLPRSQLNQQQVKSYENEEINKTNNILHKYIQLSNDAQVRAETVHVESNDIAKSILELISVLNIKKMVMGIKKPPHSWGKNKLSRGEIVKQNAPEFCEVSLVCHGNEILGKGHYEYDIVSQHRHSYSSPRFLSCMWFSGRVNGADD